MMLVILTFLSVLFVVAPVSESFQILFHSKPSVSRRHIIPSVTTALSGSTISSDVAIVPETLDEKQLDFVLGYLNKHERDVLKAFAEAFSPLGSEMASANTWSGGSYAIGVSKITGINKDTVTLEVEIERRGKGREMRTVEFSLTADAVPERARYYKKLAPVPETDKRNIHHPRLPIDDIVRKLCRLCWIVDKPAVTGRLIQLAIQLGGAGIGKLPENMYLNQVPHNRYVRQWFYDQIATAVHDAAILCSRGKLTNLQKVVALSPETNTSMDSYRIGTLLEMVRAVAIRLAEENLRVRVCVQESMGQGIFTALPKSLSGVARLLQAMDWQAAPGELNEGMIGNFVRFGGVGKQHVMNRIEDENGNVVQHQDDVFVIIAPQSMVGTDTSIIPILQEMVDAAGDRPVVLVNPDLDDKVSAAGQQSIRGRQQRLDFANSFETIFHFQNIYISGTSYFPILGSTTKLHPEDPYIVHQRRDLADKDGEVYVPVICGEIMPSGESILSTFEM